MSEDLTTFEAVEVVFQNGESVWAVAVAWARAAAWAISRVFGEGLVALRSARRHVGRLCVWFGDGGFCVSRSSGTGAWLAYCVGGMVWPSTAAIFNGD